jgi:hypothetical protein
MHLHRNTGRQTGTTGRTSIHISNSERGFHLQSELKEKAKDETKTTPPEQIHLFERAESEPLPLPERFPRLAFLAVAIALLVTALTAEFDYLRGAGYFWP